MRFAKPRQMGLFTSFLKVIHSVLSELYALCIYWQCVGPRATVLDSALTKCTGSLSCWIALRLRGDISRFMDDWLALR